MGLTDARRLERLLGGPDLAWLVSRVRKRMARGESLETTVTLTDATEAQRAAIHRLLGRRPRPGGTLTVSLPSVDEVLRRSGACSDGLARAIIALSGEVPDRAAEGAALEGRWEAALAPLHTLDTPPELAEWVARIRSAGLLRRLTGTPEAATPLVVRLAEVLQNLPARGEPLGQFAARYAGDAHALDHGRPLATLALGGARALSGLPDGTGAQWRREVWASVGLLTDDVSSTVLTLGLPGDPETATGRALAAWRSAGQPVVLTLRQLVRDPPRPVATRCVFICENPAVVSVAADRLGAGCAPLICTYGQPGAAVLHLLRLLAASGATLRYHGDFDWGGLRIGNVLFDRVPALPWRFGTADYLAAGPEGRRLGGPPVTATWDPDLGATMHRIGAAVEEEHILDLLLTDLAG